MPTKALFTARDQELTVDGHHILEKKDWPSFSGSTLPCLAAQGALLRHCSSTKSWESAGRAWTGMLLPPGCIVHHKRKYYLNLGSVGFLANLAVELKRQSPKSSFVFFSFQSQDIPMPQWLCLLDPEETLVFPTE
eukprot:12903425-Prorocentrum_lima.AAC.1